MYKNQLQELAQRSCFNLPSYACTRQGPDHAPRFKACVNFNGEVFESPTYCTTLRQAEHSAAQVALNNLSTRGPSRSLTARVLDETGVYKNLLQETAHRAGLKLPLYTTVRSGPGHAPVFTCSVELAGMIFTGDSGKTKKQAEKNAAIAAWSSLKKMPNLMSLFESSRNTREQNQVGGGGSGRKMVRGKRVISSNISGSYINHLHLPHDQQRMFMDLLISEEGVFPSSGSGSNKSFVSLLPPPPPPPRTTSKILPPLLSTNIKPTSPMVQVKNQEVQPPLDPQDYNAVPNKSDAGSKNVYGANPLYSLPVVQVQKEKVQTPLDHRLGASNSATGSRNVNGTHQNYRVPPMVQVIRKDVQPPLDHKDHDLVASKSATSSRHVYGANPVYNISHEKQTHKGIGSNFVGPDQLMAAISSSINFPHPTTTCSRNIMSSKGYAPAVQMRSVIPVCAAAPVRPSSPEQLPPKSTPTHLPLVKAAEVSSKSTSLGQLTSNLNDKLQL